MENKFYLNFFKNLNMQESDQEAFLLWCLNYLSEDSSPIKKLSQQLIYLFLGKPSDISYTDINRLKYKNITYRQQQKIDIVILFMIKEKKYALGLEHKVFSNKPNDYDKYHDKLIELYKGHEVFLCLLDPFKTQNIDILNKKNKEHPIYVTDEFYNTLSNFIEEQKDESVEKYFIKDYLESFFEKFNLDINCVSRHFSSMYKFLVKGYNSKLRDSKTLEINVGKFDVIFNGDSWLDGRYHLTIEEKSKQIKIKEIDDFKYTTNRSKSFIIKGTEKLSTLGDIKIVVDAAIEALKTKI